LIASIISLAVAEDGPSYPGSYLDDGSPLMLL
jgi:hypothetical protein